MQLITFVDVVGELRMFEDGWKGYEMVGWCGDPWVTFCGFLEVFLKFGLKTGHYRKTYRMY